MKTCTKCGEIKPLNEYHKDKRRKDGKVPQCKVCVRSQLAVYRSRPEVKATRAKYNVEYMAEYNARPEIKARRVAYSARPEVKAHKAEYNAKNLHLGWEGKYRRRATKYGFGHLVSSMQSFTSDELISRWGDACYLCGGVWDQLEHVTPVSRGGEHSLSNCRPVCGPCNRRAWVEFRRAETA